MTKKTKSIALCARFGPNPTNGFKNLIEGVRSSMLKAGDSSTTIDEAVNEMNASMERVLAARNPDDASVK